jgi:hypothetical protein
MAETAHFERLVGLIFKIEHASKLLSTTSFQSILETIEKGR